MPADPTKIIDDGGSAFPAPGLATLDGKPTVSASQGMTLRDWFAGQALAGHDSHTCDDSYEGCAERAYKIADAMLEARRNRG